MLNSNLLTTSTDYSRLLVTNTYTIVHTWNATIVSVSTNTTILEGVIDGNINHLNISVNGGDPVAGFGLFQQVGSRSFAVMVGLVDGVLQSYMALSGSAGSQTITITYTIIATHPIY